MVYFPPRLRRAALGLLLSGSAAITNAATLQISPVTIELGGAARGAAITLANPGETPLYGQLRVFEWDQEHGEDTLQPTQNLVASPPLIEVAPGGQQLVRLIRTAESSRKEQSYRVIIDEIVDEHSAPRHGVVIRMRYSVPVFVDNGLPRGDGSKLEWTLAPGQQRWQLRIDNQGGRRARISSVWLRDAKGRRHDIQAGLLGYALGGRHRVWELDIPSSVELGSRPKIHATVDTKPVLVTAKRRSDAMNAEKGKEW